MPFLAANENLRNHALLEAIDSETGPLLERLSLSCADVEWKLLEGEADIALASPLVFAKREGDLSLIHI